MTDSFSPARVLFTVPTLGLRMDLLRDSLESIRAQNLPDLDLVLVAPPRADIEELAREYDARVVSDPSRGLSGALNAGLAAARPGTEFFAWLGDDDLLTPGSLQTALDALDRRPDASMVYGWCDYMAPDGTVVFSSRAGRWAARLIGWGPNLVPQPGSVQRLAMTRAVGGLDETLKFGMDLDLFLKLRELGPLINVDSTLAHFRWHPDSNTVSNQDRSSSESEEIRLRYLGPTARAARPVVRGPVMWSLAQARAHVTRRSRRVSGAPHA
jgi:GT2 family glycosyltransferase